MNIYAKPGTEGTDTITKENGRFPFAVIPEFKHSEDATKFMDALNAMPKKLEDGCLRIKIEPDPYTGAKKTIEEIKVLQKNIEKLIAEIRELCFGFDPNKILEKK